ncbi:MULTISPECIES: hypothetical protein [unclassified Breznakia]|uniref:hypothetical protein n=1 Tax=unclassified Breznakia TaxID=2623764 RepID=UPI00247627A7|nr:MULTISPECIES: hypothetical protein [unclassified Breznakia]MDH6367303.1 hypothetical protein [Breznakia sp. PH1-1]MDH6404549.1 hypothetical protein [Breznakia sp. PF1-11]MDH6412258.1 hypothetical protein [Breznakia sp. PFB1-11]MDH6414470.1 hypothetical protein [Breznakia sp. PFB1-14]MDH6416922.1 hypothetical protein [Breznakia sp. PFB1-4]
MINIIKELSNKHSVIALMIYSSLLIVIPFAMLTWILKDARGTGEFVYFYKLMKLNFDSCVYLAKVVGCLMIWYASRKFLLRWIKNSFVAIGNINNAELFTSLYMFLKYVPQLVVLFIILLKAYNFIMIVDLSQIDENVVTIVSSIIGFGGVVITVIQASKTIKNVSADKMHDSTSWRSNLMEVASKKKLNLDDVLRVLSAVSPYGNQEDFEKYSKNNMVEEIHKKVRKESNKIYEISMINYTSCVAEDDAKKIRLYARVLLKIDWIVNTNYRSRNEFEKLIQIKEIKESFLNS